MCIVASYGGSRGGGYPNVAPGFDSNLGKTYDQYSPGNVAFDTGSEGVSNTYNQPMEPSFTSRPVYTPTSGKVGYMGKGSVRNEPPSSMRVGYGQPDIGGKKLTGLT